MNIERMGLISNWQRDSRWRNVLLGGSRVTIGGYGCTISCIGNLVGESPLEVNEKLREKGGYSGIDRNLVNWEIVARIYDLEWRGFERKASVYPVIAEVRGLPGYNQHFVVILEEGNDKILDPWWGGVVKMDSRYRIVSYRGLYRRSMKREEIEKKIANEFRDVFGSCPRTQYLVFEARKVERKEISIRELKNVWRNNIKGYQKHIFNAVQYVMNDDELMRKFVGGGDVDFMVERRYDEICNHYIEYRAKDGRTDRVNK